MGKVQQFEKKEGASSHGELSLGSRAELARSWLNNYQSNTGFSWAQIAREIKGYSKSTLSLFASDKYKASEQLVHAIEQYQEIVEARRESLGRIEFVPTSISRRVLKAIWTAQLLQKMAIIMSDSGVGKTTTLKQFVAETPNSAYIALNPTIQRPYSLLPQILGVVGGSNTRMPPDIVYAALLDKLRGTGKVLIIDEANFLNGEALNTIRCIQEESGCPMVLSGNTELYESAARKHSAASFVQFESRCAVKESLTVKDITAKDVELIAAQIIGVELTAACLEQLHSQATEPAKGGLRYLVSILSTAKTDNSVKRALTKTQIRAAIEKVSGFARWED